MTVELALRSGEAVRLDDEDVALVGSYTWHLTAGYAARKDHGGEPRTIYMHREILGLKPGDGIQVDHVNRDQLDNRRSNLRLADDALNRQNTRAHRDGSSRYRGVSWDAARGRWQARVTVAGRTYYLGRFDDEDDAGRAAAEGRRSLMPYATD